MNVGLIIPADTPPTGGNSISARRVKEGLQSEGLHADTVLYQDHLPSFDIYHGWNANRVGVQLVRHGINPHRMVVTWTGTDLWQDWVADYRPIADALDDVACQVVFTDDARTRILDDKPGWADRIHVISPSVNEQIFAPSPTAIPLPHPLVLLAGGVRPVKRSAWAIDLVEATREATEIDIHMAVAGPVRHLGEWGIVKSKASGNPWVHLLGEVPKEEMPDWYNAADVVINTSAVEGVSNALLEALACGSLVLCSNIAGNRYLVENGANGLLFSDEEEFVHQLTEALKGGEFVRKMRLEARQRVLARHSLQLEVAAYRSLYDHCQFLVAEPKSCSR